MQIFVIAHLACEETPGVISVSVDSNWYPIFSNLVRNFLLTKFVLKAKFVRQICSIFAAHATVMPLNLAHEFCKIDFFLTHPILGKCQLSKGNHLAKCSPFSRHVLIPTSLVSLTVALSKLDNQCGGSRGLGLRTQSWRTVGEGQDWRKDAWVTINVVVKGYRWRDEVMCTITVLTTYLELRPKSGIWA